MALAVGFRFVPTDEELVEYYLKPRLLHQPLPSDVVLDFDIYQCNPWDLPRHPNHPQLRELYFFTPRHAVSTSRTNRGARSRVGGPTGAHCSRTAGCGVWHGNGRDNIITNSEGEEIAHSTSFKFEKIEQGKKERTKTEWLMHEYRLLPSFPRFEDLVLCKIYEKKTKSQEENEKRQLKRMRMEAPISEIVTVTDSVSLPTGEPQGEANLPLAGYSEAQPNSLVPYEAQEAERMHVDNDNGDLIADTNYNTTEAYGGGEEVAYVEGTVGAEQAQARQQQQRLMNDNIEIVSYVADNACGVAANEVVAVEVGTVQRQAEEVAIEERIVQLQAPQQCSVTDSFNDQQIHDVQNPNSTSHLPPSNLLANNDLFSLPPPVANSDSSNIWTEDFVRSLQPLQSLESDEYYNACVVARNELVPVEVGTVQRQAEVAVEERIVQRQAEEPEQQQCSVTESINDRQIHDVQNPNSTSHPPPPNLLANNDLVSLPPPVANSDASNIWSKNFVRSLQPFERLEYQKYFNYILYG